MDILRFGPRQIIMGLFPRIILTPLNSELPQKSSSQGQIFVNSTLLKFTFVIQATLVQKVPWKIESKNEIMDSNIWGHNSTIHPTVSAAPRIETYDSINEEYFGGDLDSTDEVEKVSWIQE